MAYLVFRNLAIYWKSLFIIIYPLVLLPIFVGQDEDPKRPRKDLRCMYVVLLMAGFWVLEVLPLAITALIPVVAFPLLGISNTKDVTIAYFKETNMMFVGGLIVALAIEYCNLHTRISLLAIRLIGCSYRLLNLGLVTLTMLVSMWISNTAATAMMLPIIEAVLQELDAQGVGRMWEEDEEQDPEVEPDPSARRPTRVAMCFYISTAYAASIGGLGCIVGSGTNLALKGIYEELFPDSPGVEFNKWFAANSPLMLAIMYPSWIWLQFWFMGLWRPNCKDAQAINMGKEGEDIARSVLTNKLKDMGPLTHHEILVAIMFVLVVLLWFLRRPDFMPGWPSYITTSSVGDSTCAFIVVILLFILPARFDFIYMFSKDETKRPTKPAPALITWRYIHQKMHWSLIFLLGGGFALSQGIKDSGMGTFVAGYFQQFSHLTPFQLLAMWCFITMIITQITSNVAMANILLPIVANIAQDAEVHPMYLMMAVDLTCSFSYTLPVSTPPNAIAAAPCNMPSIEMMKCASVVQVIAYLMLLIIFPHWGSLFWDFSTFPEWAKRNTTNSTT